MINKLRDAGFNNTACSWFQSYLSNRTQSVRYAGSISDPLLMNTGRPQGSNLSPLMFIIYINDLLISLPSYFTLAYADDISLIALSSTESDAIATLQMLVNTVICWCTANNLCVNTRKSVWLLISPKLIKPTSTPSTSVNVQQPLLSSSDINRVSSIRLLGVQLTDNLCWNYLIDMTCKKICNMLGAIRRASNIANANVRPCFVAAYVMPRMLCCLPIWGNCSSLSANRLNRALKRLLCAIKRVSCVEFTRTDFEAFGLMPYEFLLRLKNVWLVHKFLHNEDVSMPSNSFSFSKLNSRSTRGAESNRLKLIKTHR